MALSPNASPSRAARSARSTSGGKGMDASMGSVVVSSTSHRVGRISSVAPDDMKELGEFLNTVLAMLGDEMEPEGEEQPDGEQVAAKLEKRFEFTFMHQSVKGCALHIASLHPDGVPAICALIEKKANVEQQCQISVPGGHTMRKTALHLAAGRGNMLALCTLIQEGADVNAQMLLNGEPHDAALHEATFFQKTEVVGLLLEKNAEADIKNRNKQTSLHLAAMLGFSDVAKVLVQAGASLFETESGNQRPLMLALDFSLYPHDKLFWLAARSIGDVLLVAHRSPSAASKLLRDRNSTVHPSWAKALLDDGDAYQQLQDLVAIMDLAPQAAEDLLAAVTVQPKAAANRHPVPLSAVFGSNEVLRCHYCEDKLWKYDAETGYIPPWHAHIAPSTVREDLDEDDDDDDHTDFRERVADHVETCFDWLANVIRKVLLRWLHPHEAVTVRLRYVNLPGVLHPKLFHALAHTEHLPLFANYVVQAVVKCAWRGVAKTFYTITTIYRVVEMIVLLVWVLQPSDSDVGKSLCWSILFITCFRDLFYELHQLWSSSFVLKKPWGYIYDPKNYVDLLSIGLLLTLVILTERNQGFEHHPKLTAVVALCRWFQLCYTFRAFTWTGEKIMPLLKSVWPLGGIVLITAFTCAGFLHAFLALEAAQPQGDFMRVYLSAFTLLFAADGAAMDTVLSLGGAPSEGSHITRFFLFAAIGIFCVCVLNLFIAVHGEAYDAAQERAAASFIQERAAICLQCLLRPHWPATIYGRSVRLHRPFRLAFVVLLAAFTGHVLLLYAKVAPIVPSLILLVFVVFTDALYLQRPWEVERVGEDGIVEIPNYLWICVRADFDPSDTWPAENGASDDLPGRLISVKKDNMLRYQRLNNEVTSLRELVDQRSMALTTQTRKIRTRVENMEQSLAARLDRLELTLESLVTALRKGDAAHPPHNAQDS